MNYYENVVVDYLRADRAIFVNTECCIQLNQAENPDTSGPHWYCDAIALDLRAKAVFLWRFLTAGNSPTSPNVSRDGTITGDWFAKPSKETAFLVTTGRFFVHGYSCRRIRSR